MSSAAAADAAPTLPSGLVTFLFTDVVGSTRLFQAHGEAFVSALQDVQDAVRAAVEGAGGAVVHTEGDGTFAAFWSASDGLQAALAAQRAVAAVAGPPQLTIRAGLHTGHARPLQGDYLAVPVHVASRVSSAASAGQVLITGDTVAALGVVPEAAADLGLFELRDVIEPVRLWRVAGPPEPPRASPVRKTNVQPPHTSLIGRDDVLAEVAELLATHRLVTLAGTGGVGKTRLASEVAINLAPSFDGGAWLVELAAAEHDDLVGAAVRRALAVPHADPVDDPLVAELNRRGPTLLVLDNCEHVLDGAAELAEHLLRASPTTRLLATSREVLDLPDERVVRLLALADSPAAEDAAEELFRQRAERAGVILQARDQELVREICALLDGLPLAIELAASRAASMPLTELRTALERDAHLVPLAQRRRERRQRSLDDLVDWTVRMLTADERADLMCLSAFAARFTGADAETLLTAARGPRPSALGELVRRALVDVDGDRYRMLFSVRVPMANRLAADAELAAATDAALVTWANQRAVIARTAGWRGALDELAPERANLEAALRAAIRRRLPIPRALQMLDRIWDRDGTGTPADLREGLAAWLAEPVEDADGVQMALSIVNVSRGVGMSSDVVEHLALANQLLEVARRLGDVQVLVDALSTLSPIVVGAGERDRARAMSDEVIALAGQGGEWHRPARDLVNRAVLDHIGAQPLDALPWYDAAIEAAIRDGDEDNLAVAFANKGDVLMQAGQLRQATEALRRGVKGMAHMSRSETAARVMLAEALLRLGEPNALEFAREAERDLSLLSRGDRSMTDYLERLRITIAAAEGRDSTPGASAQ